MDRLSIHMTLSNINSCKSGFKKLPEYFWIASIINRSTKNIIRKKFKDLKNYHSLCTDQLQLRYF